MSRGPRTAHRLDSNHKAICDVFTRHGLLVLSLTSLGGGAPDILICNVWTQALRLVEIKTAKGKIRKGQQDFAGKGWPVQVIRDEAAAHVLSAEMIRC